MKIFLSILLVAHCGLPAFTQNQVSKTETLSDKQVKSTFTDAVKNDLELAYPIFRIFKYSDHSGQFYTILTESRDSTGTDKNIFNKNIRAVTAKYENGKFINKWEINDFADKKKEENNIWFWTKYAEFKDYDNDSEIDPILVYGASGENALQSGMVKFVIYYKGKKILVRCQDSDLDRGRLIQADKAFYSLPSKLQDSVKDKMKLIEKSNQLNFPNGWQKGMENNQTTIKE